MIGKQRGPGRAGGLRRGKRGVVSCLALATVGVLVAACGSSGSSAGSSTGIVKIGFIDSLSGIYSFYGIPALDGLKLAISQINKDGFVVNGRRYKFSLDVGTDIAGNASNAASDARTLISGGVKFFYGPVSLGTEAILPITNAYHAMLLTASTTIYTDLGPQNPLLFRVSVDDTWRGSLDVKWIRSVDPSAKSIALIQPNDAEGQEVMATEAAEMAAGGLNVVDKVFYPSGTVDFTPFLTSIAALHPSLLAPAAASPDNLEQVRQGINLHVSPDYYAGFTVSQMQNDIPASFTGNLYGIETGPQFDIPTTAKAKAYISQLNAFMHGKLPPFVQYSDYYYDSTFMLVKAMEAAGSVTDPQAVAKKFSTISYDGMYGTLTYHGGHKIDYPVDNCIFAGKTRIYSCKNYTLTPAGTLQVLGSASEKLP